MDRSSFLGQREMATVAGAGSERMLLRQRRVPLGDLTNFSSSTSVLTRLKPST
jgi:hypothetical protein